MENNEPEADLASISRFGQFLRQAANFFKIRNFIGHSQTVERAFFTNILALVAFVETNLFYLQNFTGLLPTFFNAAHKSFE